MQTIQCVKKVCETICKQVPVTTTVCDPVTVTRKISECKMVCTPTTITKQVPVEICVKVPVVVHCPSVVSPTEQTAIAPTPQATH
jgi:hypothetical protein